MTTTAIITTSNLDGVTLNVVNGKVIANDPNKIAVAEKGMADGVASLDSAGKVLTSQLPAAILGGVNYQGTWNAETNTPVIANGVGVKGHYYLVSVGGFTVIDGNNLWKAGDQIVFDGTRWEQVTGGEVTVRTVAGKTGDVTLLSSDITDFGTATAAVAATEIVGVSSSVVALSSSLSSTNSTVVVQGAEISTLSTALSSLNSSTGGSNVALSSSLSSVTSTTTVLSSSLSSTTSTTVVLSSSLSSEISSRISSDVSLSTAVSSSLSSVASTAQQGGAPTVTHAVDLVNGEVTISVNGVSTVLTGVTLTDAGGVNLGVLISA